jgi:hypothetical protein
MDREAQHNSAFASQEGTKEVESPQQSKMVPTKSDRSGSTRQVTPLWRTLAVISASGAAVGAVVGMGVWYYNRHALPKPSRPTIKRPSVVQQDIESSSPTVFLL